MNGLLRTLPRIRTGVTGWPWDEETPPPAELTPNGLPWPTIAIVTPSFNQASFIEETLRSVLLQNYPRLKYIVMDGGSTDGSAEIIRAYEPWLTHWTSAADGGQSDAIERGFTHASGATVYGWLNSDDILFPGVLAAVGAFFAETPGCEWLSGDGTIAYESRQQAPIEKTAGEYTSRDLLMFGFGKFLPQPSVFFAQSLYNRVGGLKSELRYAMDLDLWIRMSELAKLHHLQRTLSMLRQHEAAKTSQHNHAVMTEVEAVVRSHGRGILGPADLALAIAALRKEHAGNLCASALAAYFSEDRPAAWRALARAVMLYPPVVCGRAGAGLLLRLTLPARVKAGLFTRP